MFFLTKFISLKITLYLFCDGRQATRFTLFFPIFYCFYFHSRIFFKITVIALILIIFQYFKVNKNHGYCKIIFKFIKQYFSNFFKQETISIIFCEFRFLLITWFLLKAIHFFCRKVSRSIRM